MVIPSSLLCGRMSGCMYVFVNWGTLPYTLINHWVLLWNLSYLILFSLLHVTLFNVIVYVKWFSAWGHQFIWAEWSLLGLKDTQFALDGEKGFKRRAPFVYFILDSRYTYYKAFKNLMLRIQSIEIFDNLMGLLTW